jgi:hypothetical protein
MGSNNNNNNNNNVGPHGTPITVSTSSSPDKSTSTSTSSSTSPSKSVSTSIMDSNGNIRPVISDHESDRRLSSGSPRLNDDVDGKQQRAIERQIHYRKMRGLKNANDKQSTLTQLFNQSTKSKESMKDMRNRNQKVSNKHLPIYNVSKKRPSSDVISTDNWSEWFDKIGALKFPHKDYVIAVDKDYIPMNINNQMRVWPIDGCGSTGGTIEKVYAQKKDGTVLIDVTFNPLPHMRVFRNQYEISDSWRADTNYGMCNI